MFFWTWDGFNAVDQVAAVKSWRQQSHLDVMSKCYCVICSSGSKSSYRVFRGIVNMYSCSDIFRLTFKILSIWNWISRFSDTLWAFKTQEASKSGFFTPTDRDRHFYDWPQNIKGKYSTLYFLTRFVGLLSSGDIVITFL